MMLLRNEVLRGVAYKFLRLHSIGDKPTRGQGGTFICEIEAFQGNTNVITNESIYLLKGIEREKQRLTDGDYTQFYYAFNKTEDVVLQIKVPASVNRFKVTFLREHFEVKVLKSNDGIVWESIFNVPQTTGNVVDVSYKKEIVK